MPTEYCEHCGNNYNWKWEEAFDKFGFNDGYSEIHTCDVVEFLRDAGYTVESGLWGTHNEIIGSIINTEGDQMIPKGAALGYDDPRTYLPKAIVELLDQGFPE